MSAWLLFSLLTPLLWGISIIIDQIIRNGYLKNNLALTFLGGIGRLLFGAVLLLTSEVVTTNSLSIIFILIAGMLWIYPMVPYIKALSFEEASRISLMFQLIPVFVFILSIIFLHESLTNNQLAAFILIFIANILAALKLKGGQFKFSPALLLMMLASFLFAVSDVMFKAHAEKFLSFTSALGIFMMGSGLAALSFLTIPTFNVSINESLSKMKIHGWWLVVASLVTGIGGNISFMYALTLGKVSLTSVLVGIQPLIVLGLNMIFAPLIPHFMKENVSSLSLLIKCAAVFLVMFGLYLLKT